MNATTDFNDVDALDQNQSKPTTNKRTPDGQTNRLKSDTT